jgi:dihydroorotate dehydrogenase (NAD+) catalytic subunit
MGDPIYDPLKTFDDNFDNGPFGEFASGTEYKNQDNPKNKFLGVPVYEPFGIAAGPLPNSKYTTAAFKGGYDVVVYKTQRTVPVEVNKFPNIIPIDADGDISLEQAEQGLTMRSEFNDDPKQLTITNSFGNPSRGPEYWVNDMKAALAGQGKGQLLVMSVCGTIQKNQTQDEYFQDFADAAKQAYDAGAKAIELNLSCPNVANEGIICYTPEAVKIIVDKTRKLIPNAKLVLKFGYFSNGQQKLLEQIIDSIADQTDAISVINTIPAAVYKKDGTQALPGEGRLKSGLCGAGIRWAGLDMVKRLDDLRKAKNYNFEIVGVGGVMTPEDYKHYREAGADCVQACTGPMWNPGLAADIKSV